MQPNTGNVSMGLDACRQPMMCKVVNVKDVTVGILITWLMVHICDTSFCNLHYMLFFS